uniref:Uncharacterized protein n=1 Tax=Rhizophora mucronata TaxID=61149 RepID=A0A2P2N590_RHIMU
MQEKLSSRYLDSLRFCRAFVIRFVYDDFLRASK